MKRAWIVMLMLGLTAPLAAQCDPGGGLGGTGADVIVGELYGPASYGSAGGYHAYSVGTTSCNIGTAELDWFANTNQHPVIAQNMYRLKDGRFEQIGMSWLKHGFTALQQNACGCNCQSSGTGTRLGIGCSDPYSAGLNASQTSLGPRSEVIDPANGGFFYPPTLDPPAQDVTTRRLRVQSNDVDPAQNAGALYFVEGHYVTPDDAIAGNAWNNVSHRQVNVANDGNRTISLAAPTQRQLPGIEAWQANDPNVTLVDVPDGEGGLLILGYLVTDLGGGLYQYEYALYNLNSTRAIGRFEVPMPGGVSLSSIGFHDAEYHSTEVYDGTDWPSTQVAGSLSWATDPVTTNANANALRWGTLYNFRFVANAPSTSVTIELGLFELGSGTTLSVPAVGPAGDFTIPVANLNCAIDGAEVDLTWSNSEPYSGIEITRNDVTIANLPGGATSYTDSAPVPGLLTYGVNATEGGIPSGPQACTVDFPFPLMISLPSGPIGSVLPDGGDVLEVQIDVAAGFSLAVGTETLWLDTGSGYGAIALTPVAGNQYDGIFPPIPCGTIFDYYVSAESTGGTVISFPAGGASDPLVGVSALGVINTVDELETAGGWLVGPPNTAGTGNWTLGNPNGTAAQPEDDHTASGVNCWFTGQGSVGGSIGQADVDGGITTLYSPFYDLSGASDPEISYWRWFVNDGNGTVDDSMIIQISNNGLDWEDVEVLGPGHPEASGGWFQHTFRVLDIPNIGLSGSTQIRFQVSDDPNNSIVEAAIDDFAIADVDCSFLDCNNNGIVDSDDIAGGTSADCNVNGIPDECDVVNDPSIDCNGNNVPDVCDLALGADDCDLDGVIDSCAIAAGTVDDCNGNGIPDSCDIDSGAADCDGDGGLDSCQILAGGDCDANGQLDSCEIVAGTADDCDANGTIDSCDIAAGAEDCDGDGALDSCELGNATEPDCNGNGVIDSCDISAGTSVDVDLDGIPDECQQPTFIRADANQDGGHDISDAVSMLQTIFGGLANSCPLALDANADGSVDVADPVTLLGYLFAGEAALPVPFPNCGQEPAPSGLSCSSFAACP